MGWLCLTVASERNQHSGDEETEEGLYLGECFYCTMLCRLRYCYVKSSVRLFISRSVSLRYCNHIHWNSSEIISISVCSLQTLTSDLVQGERPKRLAGIWVGYRKVAFGLQKLSEIAEDSTKVTIKDQ